ncbi:DNA-binding transcriptional regulator, MarR family [Blastococcus aggregatus]|uniref:DNA-binding transcriptional regulator, MarR family n=1 Tax=Blastococcus aggregatus TaxID=38502 RepID=A0A285UWC4_9ACTN|nr:winged helix DNA-binding protein [Blastococcus aggregatus]SOC46215.1 DNA-binding transcriptional regulator, MarR family [Blastococcus aggregatus]
MDDERPIGWWVKRLDALLEEALDSVVAAEGLTRRHWQVLHSLAGGVDQEADVVAALAGFSGDALGVVADLAARGWVDRRRAGLVQLTADGVAAHDRVSRAVGRVHRHTADGLSRQEYERTVLVLTRMVENVERALGRG